uniref:Uncharacterized protein n=1 Tax=Opuntia streptacantha TaxID=393608 RepID=A0A7C8ZPK8_OPUST
MASSTAMMTELANDGNVSVHGTITNSSLGELHLFDHHDWSGKGQYPPKIPQDEVRTFTHEGSDPDGSVAAVIYSGKNEASETRDNCGWLLAWEVPNSGRNKVYVKCGPIDEFQPGQINWDDIRNILGQSADHSKYEDPDTKTTASAKIDKGKYPADVRATFGVAKLASSEFT